MIFNKLYISFSLFFLVSFLQVTAETITDPLQNKGKRIDSVQVGVASFYDDKFIGRRTSTGEVFSQNKLTAASNRFPLNSWVKVTHLGNGHSVIVRINDRMHPRNKRLIDLSRAAASKLLYTGKGLARVEVTYLGKKKPSSGKEE